jgi:hypothetical protein
VIPDPGISRIIKTIALVTFALAVVVDAGGCDARKPAIAAAKAGSVHVMPRT